MSVQARDQGFPEELFVANEAVRHGCTVSFPYGGAADYDLLIERGSEVLKIQVKRASSGGKQNPLRHEIEGLDGYPESKVDFYAGVVHLDEVDEEPSVDVSRHVFYRRFDDVDGQSARMNYRCPESMGDESNVDDANLPQDFDFEAKIEPRLPHEE